MGETRCWVAEDAIMMVDRLNGRIVPFGVEYESSRPSSFKCIAAEETEVGGEEVEEKGRGSSSS